MRPPSGGLGIQNAKIARPVLPGAPLTSLPRRFPTAIPAVPTHASILSRLACARCEPPQLNVSDSEKRAGKDLEDIGGKNRDALHDGGSRNVVGSLVDLSKPIRIDRLDALPMIASPKRLR